jgi:O-antigen/teichoic acid export membrane protein
MYANSVMGVLSWFLPIVLGFVATPVLVSGLGHELYGVYAIILGFLSYSFTFGIGRVASKYVSEFSATGNREKISQAVSATLIFSMIVGAVGAVALALLTQYLVREVLLLPENSRAVAEIGLYIASITGLMVMISQVFQNTLQGVHKFGTYLILTNLGAVMLSGGNIVLAIAGYGIPVLIGWNLFSVLTTGTLFFVTAVNALPDFRPTLRIGSEMFSAVLRYGTSIILYQIFANVFFIFERTWVVRRFGSEALTFYFVPMLLGIYLHGLVTSFAQVLFPRLNELLSDRDALIALYRKANRIVVAVVAAIVFTLIVTGELFLSLWVGPDFGERSYSVLVIHVITFGLIATIVVVWNIAEAFRSPGINVTVTFIWMTLGSGLMLIVGSNYGLEGVALSRLAAAVATMPVIIFVERRFIGEVLTGYWLKLLSRVAFGSLLMAAVQLAVLFILPANWFGLISAVAGGVAVYAAALYLSGYFAEDEIETLRSWFRRFTGYGI